MPLPNLTLDALGQNIYGTARHKAEEPKGKVRFYNASEISFTVAGVEWKTRYDEPKPKSRWQWLREPAF